VNRQRNIPTNAAPTANGSKILIRNGNHPEQSTLSVAIQKPDGVNYATEPAAVDAQSPKDLSMFNASVGLTMSSEITKSLVAQVSTFQADLQLGPRIRIPITQPLASRLDGHVELEEKSYVCVLRDERIAMLWSDSVEGIISNAADVEDKLIPQACIELCRG
jgi:hypothetical protein